VIQLISSKFTHRASGVARNLRQGVCKVVLPSSPFPSLPSPFSSLPFPSFPLEVAPLKYIRIYRAIITYFYDRVCTHPTHLVCLRHCTERNYSAVIRFVSIAGMSWNDVCIHGYQNPTKTPPLPVNTTITLAAYDVEYTMLSAAGVRMLCAIDRSARSTNRAALSVDHSLAQQSSDRATIGRSRNNRPILARTGGPLAARSTVLHIDENPVAC